MKVYINSVPAVTFPNHPSSSLSENYHIAVILLLLIYFQHIRRHHDNNICLQQYVQHLLWLQYHFPTLHHICFHLEKTRFQYHETCHHVDALDRWFQLKKRKCQCLQVYNQKHSTPHYWFLLHIKMHAMHSLILFYPFYPSTVQCQYCL